MSEDKGKQNDRQSKNEYLEEFGQRVKEVRQHLKLLQKDFAAGLEVSGSFLSEIEKGKANPGFDVMRKFFDNYNINLSYLLKGSGELFVTEGSAPTALGSKILTGPDLEKLQELLFYVENAPVVRYAIYEFFSNYMYRNKGMIEEDMKKHKAYLEKKKQ